MKYKDIKIMQVENIFFKLFKLFSSKNGLFASVLKCIKIHEKLISNQVKENPKRFWQYVNNKRQAKSTVSNLYKAGTNKKEYYESDIENATALGKQFYSVFTIDTNEPCDVEQNSDADSKLSIDFTKEVILEKINFLKENKSPGPDEVSVRILKELAY